MRKIRKLISNPVYHVGYLLRIIFTILIYPLRILLFKKIGFLAYISMRSSIRNHLHIEILSRAQINAFVTIWPSRLKIGKYTQINPGTVIYGNVEIGNYVMIAPNCMIAGGNHNFNKIDKPMMLQGSTSCGIRIEDDVWIGANSTIIDGVVIGQGSIIGAHSLVTKNIPPYSIAFGSPAKIIKHRNRNENS